ncbi:hemin uptake protein HemP [Sulfuriferula nivalis]|uniref:hemin uptake protein HemP n=1 Tax=Sulfuriferula nivalis TaxID=2675298 RepID=UPI00138A0C9F|nr:hemin uptake protein HemP [Sulfuriferula nivalis]
MNSVSVKPELRHGWLDAHKLVPSVITSDMLFDKRDEVLIMHQGEQYRLRRTRNGKLILTK